MVAAMDCRHQLFVLLQAVAFKSRIRIIVKYNMKSILAQEGVSTLFEEGVMRLRWDAGRRKDRFKDDCWE